MKDYPVAVGDDKRTMCLKMDGINVPKGVKVGQMVRCTIVGKITGMQMGEKGDKKSKDSYMRKDRPATVDLEYADVSLSPAGKDSRSLEELEEDMKHRPMQRMGVRDE